MRNPVSKFDHDVDALECELAKISEYGYQWGQGPGSEYFLEVEVELIEARLAAGLPMLNVTYSGIGYRLSHVPDGTGFWKPRGTTWVPEQISGAFGIAQRIGDGHSVVAMILDNGEGERWLAPDLAGIAID
jgi:hypothetical protein